MKKIGTKIRKAGLPLAVCILILLLGCDSIEVDTPSHLLSGENVYTDAKTVEAAMIAIYANLRDSGLLTGTPQGISTLMGNYADELDYYSAIRLAEEPFNKNSLSAAEPTIAELWNGAYNQIYQANAILEGVRDSRFFTVEEQNQFTGESLFVRALIHFYLVSLYGDIPYITTTNYLENKIVSRMPEQEVYSAIVEDLMAAQELLPEMDVTAQHLRPNKYTALALLARVHLYTNNWELANQYSSVVIDNNGWEENIENVFLNTSSSTLWQFSPNEEGGNTLEANTFIILSAPPSERALSNRVVEAFEAEDLRRAHWVGEISDGTTTWFFPYKYKVGLGAGTSQEYSIVFRMAEQYLIRAEARTMLGDLAGAQTDINKIRNRAGLADTSAFSEAELLKAIRQERQVELFTEFGHRFFDLKRWGLLDEFLNGVKPGWNATDRVLPLPEKELLVNPNLQPQNDGY